MSTFQEVVASAVAATVALAVVQSVSMGGKMTQGSKSFGIL